LHIVDVGAGYQIRTKGCKGVGAFAFDELAAALALEGTLRDIIADVNPAT